MKQFSIAIDGPAGAGKSTIAKQIAKRLECTYIDTGAMYRAVGLYCIQHNINLEDEQAVCAHKDQIEIKLAYSNHTQVIILNGKDVTEEIRTQEVATSASKVAAYKEIREALVDKQRELAKTTSVVMDGRDIGTVVLPKATLKLFLSASAQERANRRYKEYQEKGINISYEQLLEEIEQRDIQDSTRAVSPLKRAEDGIEIDSTHLTIDEIVQHIINLLQQQVEGDSLK